MKLGRVESEENQGWDQGLLIGSPVAQLSFDKMRSHGEVLMLERLGCSCAVGARGKWIFSENRVTLILPAICKSDFDRMKTSYG